MSEQIKDEYKIPFRQSTFEELLTEFIIIHHPAKLVIEYVIDEHLAKFSLTEHGYVVMEHEGQEWDSPDKTFREFVVMVMAQKTGKK